MLPTPPLLLPPLQMLCLMIAWLLLLLTATYYDLRVVVSKWEEKDSESATATSQFRKELLLSFTYLLAPLAVKFIVTLSHALPLSAPALFILHTPTHFYFFLWIATTLLPHSNYASSTCRPPMQIMTADAASHLAHHHHHLVNPLLHVVSTNDMMSTYPD